MNEEQLLKRKIIDTANQAFNHNIYTYTNFLSINELSSVNKMSNELSFIPYDNCHIPLIVELKLPYLNYPNKPIIRQIC